MSQDEGMEWRARREERGLFFFEGDIFPIEINHKNTMMPKVRGPDH